VKRLVILISGRGSNMAALIDAVQAGAIEASIAAVISNRPDAAGVGIAAKAGIVTSVVDHTSFSDRAAFEGALAAAIDRASPDLVVLAGFMRIFSPDFVARYAGRMLNIHPSLLPSYPGVDTHRRALADGVRIHMVDDLLRTHPLVGMSRAQLEELLGVPPPSEHFRDYDYVYWLGPERGLVSIDSEWLVVRCGQDKVVSAQVVTD
jgi:formyltetrahydrofolate-dependent phosphoribosylglycinamide formyltransferase